MDIGQRLRQLRNAKGMSQGDIEKRTRIFRSYVSQVELGHIVPQFPTLERWANALGVSLAELFTEGRELSKPSRNTRRPFEEERLLELVNRIDERGKRLLLSIASKMANQRRRA
jgi:transcriptional regulator with XRE-family HTH domain